VLSNTWTYTGLPAASCPSHTRLLIRAVSLISISEYVKNIQKISERLKDMLAEIISDMKKMGKRAFIDVNATFTPTAILSNDGWEEMNTREDFLTRLSEFDPDDTITLVDYHM
jgi:hypothetical protein